ncbi:hypothetical protein Rs2_29072 [Raphanus sativus]|nr:hypothetical protein Rs2_29072 [Raphanus sativus]
MSSLLSDEPFAGSPGESPSSPGEVNPQNSFVDSKLQSPTVRGVIPTVAVPSYAERFKSSLRNLKKISNPTFLADGTPMVQAPTLVLMKTAEIWKDHIVAHFHGTCPPPGKIFADLNTVWGKFGDITISMRSENSCLIYFPNVQSREWVLQVGYWQVDHCAVSVFPWTAEGTLQDLELRFAPTWVILKSIPPQLYSLDGISVVASAIGEPLHTEKSRLEPYHFGDTKVKIEIDLSVLPPEVVEVRDAENNSVRIKIEYPKLPPKCCNYGKFGHLMNRCPKPPMKRKFQHPAREKERVKVAMAPPSVSVSESKMEVVTVGSELTLAQSGDEAIIEAASSASPSTQKRARSRSRARARRRSRSTHPAFRLRATSCDGAGEVAYDGSDDKLGSEAPEEKFSNLEKVADERNDLGGDNLKNVTAKSDEEGSIWLQPKSAKRAQKQKARQALWNASGGQFLKNSSSSFLNREKPRGGEKISDRLL